MANVKIPSRSGIVDEKLGDVAAPTADLCRELNLMSPDGAVPAIDMIKSDALALSKWVAGLVGAGGTLAATITAFWAWLAQDTNTGLKITIIAVTGLIVVAAILVVGWVVVTDVNARAATQQARYEARSHVVHDYFETITAADFTPKTPGVGVYLGTNGSGDSNRA